MENKKLKRRKRIHHLVRKKIEGSAERPRLSVFRSNNEIYAQLIDDNAGHTLASFSSKEKTLKGMKANKTEMAKNVGLNIGKVAIEKGIQKVVFDRGGFLYHGRIKALAEGAREAGLQF